jgi:hypothetical protein
VLVTCSSVSDRAIACSALRGAPGGWQVLLTRGPILALTTKATEQLTHATTDHRLHAQSRGSRCGASHAAWHPSFSPLLLPGPGAPSASINLGKSSTRRSAFLMPDPLGHAHGGPPVHSGARKTLTFTSVGAQDDALGRLPKSAPSIQGSHTDAISPALGGAPVHARRRRTVVGRRSRQAAKPASLAASCRRPRVSE